MQLQPKPHTALISPESSVTPSFNKCPAAVLYLSPIPSISRLFRDILHILAYALVLLGLFITATLAPLADAYPVTFGVWEYAIRIVCAFPMTYLIVVVVFPFFMEVTGDEDDAVSFPRELDEDADLGSVALFLGLLFLIFLAMVCYLVWQIALIPWFIWLLILMFKKYRIR